MLIYEVACTYIDGHASIELSTIRKQNSTSFRGRKNCTACRRTQKHSSRQRNEVGFTQNTESLYSYDSGPMLAVSHVYGRQQETLRLSCFDDVIKTRPTLSMKYSMNKQGDTFSSSLEKSLICKFVWNTILLSNSVEFMFITNKIFYTYSANLTTKHVGIKICGHLA